jgi:competence CoiA-like predicted nuclease
MSGGRFEYKQNNINYIADQIEEVVLKNSKKKIDNKYPEEVIEKFKEGIDIYENNPRIIKDYKFKQLVKSIKEFPERLKACKEAGLKEVWVLKADELTEEQQREFIVKDNVGFGEWDWDVLANEWNNQQLEDWGLDLLPFEDSVEDIIEKEEQKQKEQLTCDVCGKNIV